MRNIRRFHLGLTNPSIQSIENRTLDELREIIFNQNKLIQQLRSTEVSDEKIQVIKLNQFHY